MAPSRHCDDWGVFGSLGICGRHRERFTTDCRRNRHAFWPLRRCDRRVLRFPFPGCLLHGSGGGSRVHLTGCAPTTEGRADSGTGRDVELVMLRRDLLQKFPAAGGSRLVVGSVLLVVSAVLVDVPLSVAVVRDARILDAGSSPEESEESDESTLRDVLSDGDRLVVPRRVPVRTARSAPAANGALAGIRRNGSSGRAVTLEERTLCLRR